MLALEQAARIVLLIERWAGAGERVGRDEADWDPHDAYDGARDIIKRNAAVWKFIDDNIGGIPGKHEPQIDHAYCGAVLAITGCSCGWQALANAIDTDDQFAHHVAVARVMEGGSTEG